MNIDRQDQRALSFHDHIQQKEKEKYDNFFESNVFEGIEEVIFWLRNEFLKRLKIGDLATRMNFDNAVPISVEKTIAAGDIFFYQLFDDEKYIKEEWAKERIENPFSRAVEMVYNDIWKIQNVAESSCLIIYSELKQFIERLLAIQISQEKSLTSLKDLQKVFKSIENNRTFYRNWIDNLNVGIIENLASELIIVDENTKVFDLVDTTELKNREQENLASRSYEKKMLELANDSSWIFVNELTSMSDIVGFREDISFKESLLLKLDIKNFLQWIDRLKWPLAQDHAFLAIKGIISFEEIIEIIMSDEIDFETNTKHLLLITLKNYFSFLEKISLSLYTIQKGEWSHYDALVKQEVLEIGKERYQKWIESELRDSCAKVFQTIFQSSVIIKSIYFDGVFEWLCSYSKTNPINNQIGEPSLLTIEVLETEFQKVLNQDSENKNLLLEKYENGKTNWQVLEKFVEILNLDQDDLVFRNKLHDKYLLFLANDSFNWNSSFDFSNHYIQQASKYSFVFLHFKEPIIEWKKVFEKFKVHYEGWSITNGLCYKSRMRESYVLFVGACLIDLLFQTQKKTDAIYLFDFILKKTIHQSRISTTKNNGEYSIVLRMMACAVAIHYNEKTESFADELIQFLDDEEDFFIAAYELKLQLNEKNKLLAESIRESFKPRIEANFWIIENRFNNYTQKNLLEFYTKLKDEILSI